MESLYILRRSFLHLCALVNGKGHQCTSWTTYIVLNHGHRHASRSARIPSTGPTLLSSRTDSDLGKAAINERWNRTSDTSFVIHMSRLYAQAGFVIFGQATCAKHRVAHYLGRPGCVFEHQARIKPSVRNKIWIYWCRIRYKWFSQHTSSMCKTCTSQFTLGLGMVTGEQISPSWSH